MPLVVSLLFLLAAGLYCAQGVVAIVGVWRPVGPGWARRFGLAATGAALHTAFLVCRALAERGLPLATRLDSLALFLWVLVVVFLACQRPYKVGGVAPVFWPGLGVGAVLAWAVAGREPVAEGLERLWLVLHLVPVYVGYAGFALGAGAGACYLVQERLLRARCPSARWRKFPSLETLERVGRASLSLGFPALTVGLAAGALWAVQASERLGPTWYMDPKVVAGLVVWIFYAAVLHIRLLGRVRGRWAAVLTIAGFALTVGTFAAAHFY